jgi:hydrogenase maturation protein HypF
MPGGGQHELAGSSEMPVPNLGQSFAARAFVLTGRVQGVGYRPFVVRLALRHGLTGSVRNLSGQVLIHAEGEIAQLSRFEANLVSAAPPLARPRIASIRSVRPTGSQSFEIAQSRTAPEVEIHLPPDQFVCADCLAELRDPSNHRYRYPFITCTQCGPRYTLIETLPYDRRITSRAAFDLCPACRT